MGTYLSLASDSDWKVYRRSTIDNKYAAVETQIWNNVTSELAIARFVHEVYAYSMEAYEYQDTKSIYLYKGSSRVLKAEIDPETFQLCITGIDAHTFAKTEEELGIRRGPELRKFFVRKYNNRPVYEDSSVIYALRDYNN